MTIPVRCDRALRGLSIVLLASLAASCGGSSPTAPPTSPSTGSISLILQTTGSNQDSDGYTVSLDGGTPQNVATDDTVAFSDVSPGSHQLTLAGVASNCAAGPSNPLAVSVQSGATASASFEVDCGVVMASQGGTAATSDGKARVDVPSGALSDSTIISVVPAADSALPSGAAGYVTGSAYQYRPDGTQFSKPVQITIVYDPANVPSGASQSSIRLHTVQNGQWVQVTGSTVDTTLHTVTGQTNHFSIYGAVAVQPGVLQATTSTTGSDLDPDGYQLVVDGGAGQAIGINDTLDVTELPIGDHSVELQGVASNCTVGGSNPRTVSVPSQDTARTAFSVSCTALTGDITVRTSTTGTDQDPDGYTIALDGGTPAPIAINDSVKYTNVAAGNHSVQLGNVAANCSVSPSPTMTVTAPHGGVADTTFAVACVPNVGSLHVSNTTSGTNQDPNGYSVVVDGTTTKAMAKNGSVDFSGLSVGDHFVEVTDVADNCAVQGSNPDTASISFNATTNQSFAINCVAPLVSDKVVFETNRDGNFEIYIMNLDGTGQTNLTQAQGDDRMPAVSPDGSRIAFTSTRSGEIDVWTMLADGSGQRDLSNSGSADRDPQWSPDGTGIAFARKTGGVSHIWTMNSDGTNQMQRTFGSTNDDGNPDWSPDGNTVIFSRSVNGGPKEIYALNMTTGATTNLSNDPTGNDIEPAWSPDGTKIAFTADRGGAYGDIYVMNADGTGQTQLTTNPASDTRPVWSADGTKIVFTSLRDGDDEIYIMNADGTGQTNISNDPGATDDNADVSP